MPAVLAIINNEDPAYINNKWFADSNILHFMKKYKITSYQQLIQKSNKNTEWYWDAVDRDLNLKWFRKYDRLIDQSHGISNTKWFTGGKCNIISGFNAQAVHSRLNDAGAKILITANKMQRRSVTINLRKQWIPLLNSDISKIIVVEEKEELEKKGSEEFDGNSKVISYENFIRNSPLKREHCKTEPMSSEDSLLILYTSGTTGKPKGTIQTHGGFMIVAAQQTAYLIDMKANDILFWYADIGWITGQTWVVYGSSMIGGTALVYDDALDYPESDTWCKLISKHKVTIFGAAPTAIRLFMKNNSNVNNYDLSSLRILATTGEVINKESWIWYFENIGKKQCPVINLSGGTEIGGAI